MKLGDERGKGYIAHCLPFLPSGHNNKINIGSHAGCYSYVGYQGRDHPVSLQLGSCTHHRVILHELGHTIGKFTQFQAYSMDPVKPMSTQG